MTAMRHRSLTVDGRTVFVRAAGNPARPAGRGTGVVTAIRHGGTERVVEQIAPARLIGLVLLPGALLTAAFVALAPVATWGAGRRWSTPCCALSTTSGRRGRYCRASSGSGRR